MERQGTQTKLEASHAEAKASVNVKVLTDNGFAILITMRDGATAEQVGSLLAEYTKVESWLVKREWTPDTRRSGQHGNGKVASDEQDVLTDDRGRRYKVCEIHQARMYEKSNANGSWFSHKVADDDWCKGE